jgi:hypothetical protein
MTSRPRRFILLALTIGIIAITLSACSRPPRIDGGIVGTGNRVDCEAFAKKDPGSVPEDCRRER